MSRPRSVRGASSAAPVRGVGGGGRGVYVPTAKNDIYTALLGLALAAMIIGCILLVLILEGYDFKTKVSVAIPPPAAQAALAALPEKILSVRL